MFRFMGRRGFFLLIPFPRFNNAHEAIDLSRQFGAVVPGFEPDLHICSFYALALSLDSAAATSSPLNYFSSPAQGRPALKPSVKVLSIRGMVWTACGGAVDRERVLVLASLGDGGGSARVAPRTP